MENELDSMANAIVKMWANQLGGKLYSKLILELCTDPASLPEERLLFKASLRKFLEFGKTKIEHRDWRQNELKLLRLAYLRNLTWSINSNHPMLRNIANSEVDADKLETSPPLYEPNITLEELDAKVTDWYLLTEKETSFELPEEIKNGNTFRKPQSVIFIEWEHQMNQEDAKKEDDTKTPASHAARGEAPGKIINWRCTKEEDLEGQELDGEDVCKIIYAWLLALGKGGTMHEITTIREALEEAQVDASEAARTHKLTLPIRLRKDSNYYFHSFAMTKIAKRGRPRAGTKRGSTYKLIKGSAPIKAQPGQKPDQTSDEPPQE
jgi:hypothetical protein